MNFLDDILSLYIYFENPKVLKVFKEDKTVPRQKDTMGSYIQYVTSQIIHSCSRGAYNVLVMLAMWYSGESDSLRTQETWDLLTYLERPVRAALSWFQHGSTDCTNGGNTIVHIEANAG